LWSRPRVAQFDFYLAENPQVFEVLQTILLDMFRIPSTIGAQSGKKWRRVVKSREETRNTAVGARRFKAAKQSANPAFRPVINIFIP
jgi:hypothetical protein